MASRPTDDEPSETGGPRTVRFQDEGAREPISMEVSAALADALGRAAAADPAAQFQVSFNTLFLGLAAGADPVASWLTARLNLRTANSLRELSAARPDPDALFTRTRSARS